MSLEESGVPTIAVHTNVFARLGQGHGDGQRHAAHAAGVRAAAAGRPDAGPAARLHRRQRPGLQAAVHAGGDRGPDQAARSGGPQGRRARPLDPAAARARHRGEPARTVHPQPLDGLPADRAADRRARRKDAQGHQDRARQDRRQAAPDRIPRVLGIRRREGRRQRRDGRRAAGISAGDPCDVGERHHGAFLAARHRLRRSPSSTVRSATRSA